MYFRLAYLWLLLLAALGITQMHGSESLERRTWLVDGVMREALVSIPSAAPQGGVTPVVFVFHGHSSTMWQAARSFSIHLLWPEAIVIYPQGLPTPGPLVDLEGKMSGWQSVAGSGGDRDLKFFDAMLAGLRRQYRIDEKRIYATGHSNGGSFTYLLWAERGDVFAAFAPSSALLIRGFDRARPKPVLHIGSPQDSLAKFTWQERMIDTVLSLNGCGPRRPAAIGYTTYSSAKGFDVATYLYDGGHCFPSAAPELIVKFFRAHAQP